MAELFEATGCSKEGGSMHMYSEEHHLLGGQAIVGAQLVMGAGVGLAIQYQGEHRIALVLFGDGAVDEGAFHEALNLAADSGSFRSSLCAKITSTRWAWRSPKPGRSPPWSREPLLMASPITR